MNKSQKAIKIIREVFGLLEDKYSLNTNDGIVGLEKSLNRNDFFYLVFRRVTTQKIRDIIWSFVSKLIFVLGKSGDNNYILINKSQKLFFIDYLKYIYSKNPTIPYNLFPETDHKLIYQFIKTYIYLSFDENIPVDILGRDNLKLYRSYETFRSKIKISKKEYKYLGFKSIKLPDIGNFYRNYGLSIINRKTTNTVLDLGAYNGETSFLINKILKPRLIYAFEPDKENYETLLTNIELNKLLNVIAVPLGTGSKNGVINFLSDNYSSRLVSKIGEDYHNKVRVVTIDSYFSDYKDTIDLIKMDIEGSEFDTLKGSVKTLKKYKPDLIIAIYHKGEHLFEIPKWLKNVVPEYNLRFVAFSGASPVIERVVVASVKKI